jgi:hypothetical protein
MMCLRRPQAPLWGELSVRYLASHAAVDLLDLQRSLQLLQARVPNHPFRYQIAHSITPSKGPKSPNRLFRAVTPPAAPLVGQNV